ncbi:hypothetical protein AQJ84_34565 [Streptomyces resistomycificus]|uniref:Membrane protein n=1 Tax=Streptomyces resistomycificus TaxID=67356 RepID=A0A0L8L3N4_9ACTN|nr:membrane protein [Streptomyces resistomycificus]KUN92186.1 hypothetical protein AQJ84_34565 [Streptomyces resistomycificus]
MLWIVLAVIGVPLLLIGLYFAKAIVQGAAEGWREGSEESTEYELPAEAAALGLLPPERQNTDTAAPVPADLAAAVAAAKAGDWQPAAALFDETASVRDWERRTSHCEALADVAAEDDTWLLAWEAARVDDPGAALVRARSTVFLAWNIRGGKRAQYTTGEQFEGFHRVLAQSREEHARAAALAVEGDPSPYVGEIWTALGLGYPNSEMDRLWKELTDRAPHHYEAHFSALQYWCKKWRGSERLARDFAARAAEQAPLGSLMTAFPLIAHFEHDESDSAEADRTPEMRSLVDAALTDVAAADPAHPRLAEVRHLLAFYLCLQDRDEAAVEQFRLVDGYVNALPWRYRGDKAAEFCRMRDLSLANAAAAN